MRTRFIVVAAVASFVPAVAFAQPVASGRTEVQIARIVPDVAISTRKPTGLSFVVSPVQLGDFLGASADSMPVFGTMASRFNDDGVTALYQNISSTLVEHGLTAGPGKLPRVSGFDVLDFVRGQPGLKQLPIVIFSSSDDPKDIRRAYDAGANSYLCKPHSNEDLSALLRALERTQAWPGSRYRAEPHGHRS